MLSEYKIDLWVRYAIWQLLITFERQFNLPATTAAENKKSKQATSLLSLIWWISINMDEIPEGAHGCLVSKFAKYADNGCTAWLCLLKIKKRDT